MVVCIKQILTYKPLSAVIVVCPIWLLFTIKWQKKLTMGLATPTLTDYHYEHIECSKYQPTFVPTEELQCFVEAIDSLC